MGRPGQRRGERVVTSSQEMLRGKKVVFVFGSLDLGGSERRGLLLAEYLQAQVGAAVQVVGLNRTPGKLSALCDGLGIPWRGVSFHWGLRRRIPSFLRAVLALRAAAPDIVLSYTRVPNLVCAWGARWIGAKLLIWNQADEGLLLNGSLPFRLAACVPHCFISNSTKGRDFLLETYGIAAERVHLVQNGIALPAARTSRDQWLREWEIPPGAPVVGMVANLSVYKDHETLLKGWARVVSSVWEHPPVLVLAGRGDGAEQGLQKLAAELGITAQVRFVGPVDDVAGVLQALDLFAYSSRSEGVPNGVLEAMASGVAVVGTDIPGIREAVGPEGGLHLAPVADSGKLAELIVELLRDEVKRRQLGAALRQRAEQSFSLEKMCRRSTDIIAGALAESLGEK